MAHYGQFGRECVGTPASRTEAEQKARCYLLYVFGASLYTNRIYKVHFSFLPALRDFEKAAQYDWGGLGLAVCYSFMGAVSRRRGTSLAGLWSLWELWAYEVLGLHPPETTHPQANEVLHRALCWGADFRQSTNPRVTLDTLRASLDQLSEGRVNFLYLRSFMGVTHILILTHDA
ncbi:hypothetical protein Vadar_015811 [Vaccinium darrowii]|uniref:Uncharacterized protein n=1 Tax=Vaccinium darrowii TaxID=229202 RepID=A0ACB7ZBY0_9ERIC|nr:hypothetical protein Vadar_015811 [Vaccinium darrowii]